ncbi:glycosyltransferase family 4 protein [Mucilaginibacter gotjawali]|uniref:Glycosyltransferase involved in cell wall biosynthesis n=1 Tax=Mucilaginibacter gotjawali TaxID=1550579 RepID=A0A839S9P7_9SPHI|nr:glycosyltransferase family 4 protein [Mucilaginibacter gotjawali]MBB3054082.1 glycosyltransferase involved in cell wall biosynthesis [Mucilaginibacter gotjawali]
MRKKICFVVSSPLTIQAFLLNHFKVLKAEFDIYVVANFDHQHDTLILSQLADFTVCNIKILRAINPVSDLKALISLQKYFRANKFDAVHAVTPKAGLLAMTAAYMAGVKNRVHIFTGQVWYNKKGTMKKLLIYLDKLIVRWSTHILVDGEAQRSFLISKHIIMDSNSQVLGKGSISGVDTNRFNPRASTRKNIRNELSLKDTDIVFGFLGRLNKDKGILDLASAFKALKDDYPDPKLLLIGNDEENLIPQVQQIINDSNSVIFYGPTPKPEIILQAVDIFCMPSYREGFGTSVLEASLLGLPVICSDTYGLMDTIIENETGLRHEAGNIRSLSDQMRKLIQSPELRKYLGENGARFVTGNFSAANISGEWLEFYKGLFRN